MAKRCITFEITFPKHIRTDDLRARITDELETTYDIQVSGSWDDTEEIAIEKQPNTFVRNG